MTLRTITGMNTNGRPYATVDQVVEGSRVECDGGFTCLDEGDVREVLKDNDGGLYIRCSKGEHYLDGQIDGDHYVGLYLVTSTN